MLQEDPASAGEFRLELCRSRGQEVLQHAIDEQSLPELALRVRPIPADRPGDGPGDPEQAPNGTRQWGASRRCRSMLGPRLGGAGVKADRAGACGGGGGGGEFGFAALEQADFHAQ